MSKGLRIDISVLGDKKLSKKLTKLAPVVQKKVMRRAMRDAMKLVKKRADANLAGVSPGATGSGRLAELGTMVKAKSPGQRIQRGLIRVYLLLPFRDQLDIPEDSPWYYPAFLEFGGTFTAPQSMIRNALDNNSAAIFRLIRFKLRKGILAEAKKGFFK